MVGKIEQLTAVPAGQWRLDVSILSKAVDVVAFALMSDDRGNRWTEPVGFCCGDFYPMKFHIQEVHGRKTAWGIRAVVEAL